MSPERKRAIQVILATLADPTRLSEHEDIRTLAGIVQEILEDHGPTAWSMAQQAKSDRERKG